MNNKANYKKKGNGKSYWMLDEPYFWEDWDALAFFGRLAQKGFVGVKKVQMQYRADISRPRWTFTALDGVLDICYVGGMNSIQACKIHADRTGRINCAYGSCNDIHLSHLNTVAWCYKAYLFGFDGVLPAESVRGDKAFDQPDRWALIIDGTKRFGINAIASLRVKALRRAQQDIELMNLLVKKKNYTREQIRALIIPALNLDSSYKQKFLDDVPGMVFQNVSSEQFARIRKGVLDLLTNE